MSPRSSSSVVEQPARKRDRWASRSTFIVASVGAAIGLGNVWRFPYLNYKHGGGAFLIPYFVFLIATGLPLLLGELALGRLFQKGDVMAFGAIHQRARGVGAISAIGGFGVVTYYSCIIAWAAYFFGASFKWPFPWAVEDCAGFESDPERTACATDPKRALPLPRSDSYFEDTVLNTSRAALEAGVARTISGPLYGTLLFTWIFAYFCIWKGVKSVGYAVRFTVILPWILLAVLIVYNATLEGSLDGVRAYIGEWNFDVLANGVAWSDAAGQIFFTLGSTLGIMSAYGSYAPSTTNVFADSTIVAFLNSGTSVIAGFAVFSILGNMAVRQTEVAADTPELRFNICQEGMKAEGCPCCYMDNIGGCDLCRLADMWQDPDVGSCCGYVSTQTVAKQGVFLAFSVYPATMQYLGAGSANILSVMWFGTLYLLGIDSMFAMVEGVATIITDTPRFSHVRKERVALWACLLGFFCSVAFITDIGSFLFDIFDHFLLNYGLMITGALEAYTIAWVWGWPETRARTGFASAALLTGGFTVASVLGCVIAGSLHHVVADSANLGIGAVLGLAIFLFFVGAAYICRADIEQTFRQWFEIVVWAGTRNLRGTFKHDPKRWETVVHIIFFDFMVKYISFPALLGLFINQAIADAVQYENGYQNYPDWLQITAGVIVLGSMFTSLAVFFVYPEFWDRLGMADDEQPASCFPHTSIKRNKDGEDADTPGPARTNPYVPVLPKSDGWAND